MAFWMLFFVTAPRLIAAPILSCTAIPPASSAGLTIRLPLDKRLRLFGARRYLFRFVSQQKMLRSYYLLLVPFLSSLIWVSLMQLPVAWFGFISSDNFRFLLYTFTSSLLCPISRQYHYRIYPFYLTHYILYYTSKAMTFQPKSEHTSDEKPQSTALSANRTSLQAKYTQLHLY